MQAIRERVKTFRGKSTALPFTYVVSYKTGTTIAAARLPILLLDNPPPAPSDRLFFADSGFRFGDIEVLDTYADVPQEIREQEEFAEYHKLHEEVASHHVPRGGRGFWLLARYLDPFVLAETYRRFPDRDWYIIMDDDTYVNWQTLFRWLGHFDPNQHLWFGHYRNFRGVAFAHGGSGFAVSRKRMQETFGSDPQYASRGVEHYKTHNAGDLNLGRLWANDTNVQSKGPNSGFPS